MLFFCSPPNEYSRECQNISIRVFHFPKTHNIQTRFPVWLETKIITVSLARIPIKGDDQFELWGKIILGSINVLLVCCTLTITDLPFIVACKQWLRKRKWMRWVDWRWMAMAKISCSIAVSRYLVHLLAKIYVCAECKIIFL